MFRYNPATNYKPNGGRYLQILSGKDLYKQTIVVSARGTAKASDRDRATGEALPSGVWPQALRTHTFPARFPNIFVDYLLGQTSVGNKLWTHWNKAPLKLWQTQLNFVVWCTSCAVGLVLHI